MFANQIKKLKSTPIIIIVSVSLFTIIAGNVLFNTRNLMVAKGATPPASITSRVGWVGNTYRGVQINSANSWYTSDHIPPGIQDVDAMPDGSFVSNTYSEEGYQNISTFNPDGSKKKSGYIPGGQDGGHSLSANSRYTFAARMTSCDNNNITGLNSVGNPSAPNPCISSQPNSTTNPSDNYTYYTKWFGVERYSNRVDMALDQNIPATNGWGRFASFIKIREDTSPTFMRPLDKPLPIIPGVYASETEVFISDYIGNKIQVYDVDTLAKKREFTVNKPGKITMDKDGYLWVVSETNYRRIKFYNRDKVIPTKIQKFNIDGTKQSQEIFNSTLVAGDIDVDSQNRLVVGDLSRNAQVFYYGNINSTPSIVKTVGEAGGIYSGVKGQYGDYKFVDIDGIGIDGQDNLIVGMDDYGFMKFNSAGEFQWFKHGTNWKGPGLIDPDNPNVIYSTGYKYEVDYTKPSLEGKLLAKIEDNITFPNDLKNDQFYTGEFTTPLMNAIKVCKINNKSFFITSENTDQSLAFHKFDPTSPNGELAIPAGTFYQNRPRSVINPANGAFQEGWFWNSQWDPKPAFEKQVQWWSDNNNDYTKQESEVSKITEAKYQSLGSNPDFTNTLAREFDDNCNLWIGTRAGIYYLPAGGLNASGNPIYDYNQMQKYNVPAEFPNSGDNKQGLDRFWYDPKTDSAYISGYTSAKPNPSPDNFWGWVGSSLVRYDNWMSGNPTKVWQKDIPFDVAGAQDWNRLGYSALTQVGDLIFISRSQERTEIPDSPYIMVVRISDGQRVGSLEVPADQLINRPDGPKAQRSFKMPNGKYVVSQIDVTRSKIRLWEVTPDVLNPTSPSSSSSSVPVASTPASSTPASSVASSIATSSTASSVATSTPASSVATSTPTSTPTASTPASSSANSTPMTSTAVAKKVSPAININNTATNTLAQGNSFVIANQISGAGAIANSADLSASFKPLWDGNNLYLSVEVKDDVVDPASPSALSASNQDGVEIMLDLDNSKGLTMDGMDDCKLTLVYGESTADNTFGGFGASSCNTAGVETYSTLINGGYRIDAKIPWSTLKVNPSLMDNQTIGFDVQVNDNDGGESGRDSVISYNGTSAGTIWNTPSAWGTLKLDPTLVSATNNSSNSSSSTNSDDCLI